MESNIIKNKDFDSKSSISTSSSMIGINGETTYTSESKQTTQDNKPKDTVEEFKSPKMPDYESPNQVYEDSNEDSHTYKRLNGQLDSEQNHVSNEADNAVDLERYMRRDYSYNEGDHYDYKGDRYTISDIDDPVNLLMTSERADQLDHRKEDSDARLFDSLLSNWDPRK